VSARKPIHRKKRIGKQVDRTSPLEQDKKSANAAAKERLAGGITKDHFQRSKTRPDGANY